jgi:hypothetical protein
VQRKPVAAALSSWTPESILKSILAENKGLAAGYNPDNVQVQIADPARRKLAQKYNSGSQLEFWPATEGGTEQFPRPVNSNGKVVLEVYNPQLASDPAQLRSAIYGDLLHGMSSNPYYKSLRQQFVQNFTPQETQRIKQKQSWWDDANGGQPIDSPATTDAYIRGWLSPGERTAAMQGQQQLNGTMYSPKQLQILQEMQRYLTSGEVPNGQTRR